MNTSKDSGRSDRGGAKSDAPQVRQVHARNAAMSPRANERRGAEPLLKACVR
jgi:hypothetical protein